MAQARANVPVETIRYIEAHGTGTPLGDPIEFEALCRVFQSKTGRKQFCYLGSIKGNVGHPTNAAGAAGFIKAALVLASRRDSSDLALPARPTPKIDFGASPFMPADSTGPSCRVEIRTAPDGRQFLWFRGHQRPHDSGGGAETEAPLLNHVRCRSCSCRQGVPRALGSLLQNP